MSEDYSERILEVIDSDDRFISTISFSEESIQLDFMDRTEQGSALAFGNTAIIVVNNEEKLAAYEQFQDIARLLIRDALVERRLERES